MGKAFKDGEAEISTSLDLRGPRDFFTSYCRMVRGWHRGLWLNAKKGKD